MGTKFVLGMSAARTDAPRPGAWTREAVLTDVSAEYYKFFTDWDAREILENGTIAYSKGYRGGRVPDDIASRLLEVVSRAPATAWIDAEPSTLGIASRTVLAPRSRHPSPRQGDHPLAGCHFDSARNVRKAVRRVRGGDVSGAIALLDLCIVQRFLLSALEAPGGE